MAHFECSYRLVWNSRRLRFDREARIGSKDAEDFVRWIPNEICMNTSGPNLWWFCVSSGEAANEIWVSFPCWLRVVVEVLQWRTFVYVCLDPEFSSVLNVIYGRVFILRVSYVIINVAHYLYDVLSDFRRRRFVRVQIRAGELFEEFRSIHTLTGYKIKHESMGTRAVYCKAIIKYSHWIR